MKIIIFLLPLLLKYLFLAFFVDLDLVEAGDVGEDILFVLVVFSIFYSGVLTKRFFINILCFLYVLYFVLETTSYIAVSSSFTSSYMFLLIESNKRELGEFISSYINLKIIFLLIVMIISFFIVRKVEFKNSPSKKILLAIIVPVSIIGLLKVTGLIESNAYHNIVRGIYGYYDLQGSVKFDSNLTKNDINVSSDNQVLVVVLGESTARGHMQLYGYNRETTPLLNSIKDSLFVYNNVISNDIFTLKIVPKILTSLSNDSKEELVINLIQVFNKVGFKTFWLANQRPISYHDNAINKIASASYYYKFYNYKDDVYTNILDDVIFPDYDSALKKSEKKLILIKLLGTHFDYFKRYPKSFEKFLDEKTDTKQEIIKKQYDNAVLYNDYIVYTLIEKLKKTNTKSALLYLSDHGENVYDEGTNFFGRNEEKLTKSMFEIPFLLWTSKDFKFPEDFEYEPSRAFMSDHTYESIGHLFGVKYKDMDFSKSIFSESFKERKRTVVNSLDFDTYFK